MKNAATIDYSKLVGFDVAGPKAGAVDFKSGALAGPIGAKVGGGEPGSSLISAAPGND